MSANADIQERARRPQAPSRSSSGSTPCDDAGDAHSLHEAATLFRAFSDETRLRLLNLLLEREVCVCDMCEVLNVLQPSISRHLAYLDRTGLVSVRQSGRWKYYRAVRRPDAAQRRLLNCVKSCLRDIDVLRRDLDALRRLQQQPGHCC